MTRLLPLALVAVGACASGHDGMIAMTPLPDADAMRLAAWLAARHPPAVEGVRIGDVPSGRRL